MGDKPMVIVIYCSEDGDKSIEIVRKDEFLKRLNEDYFGENPNFARPGEKIDMDYFSGLIVIDGEIVLPRPVEVVKKYDL